MVYRQEGQQLRQWERESIRFLLTNDAYIGNLVQSGKHMKEQITAEHRGVYDLVVVYKPSISQGGAI